MSKAAFLPSMFEQWKFERALNRIRKAEKKNLEGYKAARQKFKGREETEEFEAVKADFSIERSSLLDDKEVLITQHLRDEAAKYLVPLPDRNNITLWNGTDGHSALTLTGKGIQEVRNAVHEEIKKTWERRFIWVQPLSALLSLLIALGGLAVAALSLWLKKP